MKKLKFFVSLLKERDWLEDMATQGWLLNNISLGIFYDFEKVEPCEKVYEVERFAITAHPTIAEITARTRAFDVTSQFGWEPTTHDLDMNYYFVKDKAGDESDEFYDDFTSRQERAERYRKHYCIEQPLLMLLFLLGMSIAFIFIILSLNKTPTFQFGAMWLYFLSSIFDLVMIYFSMACGQRIYTELCMSRKEWEEYKQNRERKYFVRIQQLRSYLQEKNEFGLSLKEYDHGCFIFEKDTQRYNYFVDTRICLKKRLKENRQQLSNDKKDWQFQGLSWYETSIANSAQYNLKPVAVIGKSLLIYKRPYSDEALPWENGNEYIGFSTRPTLSVILTSICILAICYILGYAIGYMAGMILN